MPEREREREREATAWLSVAGGGMLGRCGTAVDNILYPWCDGQGMRQQWNFTSDLGQMSLQVFDQSLKRESSLFTTYWSESTSSSR